MKPNKEVNANPSNSIVKLAVNFEFKTNAGKYNVICTAILAILAIFFATVNASVEIVYMVIFHKPYPNLDFKDVLLPFAICSGLCFLYMIFLADKSIKFGKKIKKNHK